MIVELKKRSFDEMIKYFNNNVADMDISPSYKMELLGMITAIGFKYEEDVKKPKTGKWIPCSERLPEEDHWAGGSGKQFSDNVLVSIYNSDDEDEWVDVSQLIDGEWIMGFPPRYCKIVAWMPLPEPYWKESE